MNITKILSRIDHAIEELYRLRNYIIDHAPKEPKKDQQQESNRFFIVDAEGALTEI